jgi:hypothetical protein
MKRTEITRHIGILSSAGILDLEALPVPNGGIATQPPRGIDQSGVTG